ncbi:hypothetical protein NEOLEDRAFT_1150364 [Neolentinus lepideus HHB14362 ss-1]|uniref:Uncharacterized protein n=1 Tax=Neolentinus lepideus HHB14362 ss-1 TaxID=1314782 RepID=A0A165Q4V5_9AGAM|nr:hypothetical protein NEOLEDRAFT_1150364 [Neolentinus lepideus HHB14362 ss-1]
MDNTVSVKDYISSAILCPLTSNQFMRFDVIRAGPQPRSIREVIRSALPCKYEPLCEVQVHGSASNPLLCCVDSYFRDVHDSRVNHDNLLVPAPGIKRCDRDHEVHDPRELGDEVEGVLKTAVHVARSLGTNELPVPGLTLGTSRANEILARSSTQFSDIRVISWNDSEGSATPTMAVICIAPGYFTIQDWKSFCSVRVFEDDAFEANIVYDDDEEDECTQGECSNINMAWPRWKTVWAITHAACRELHVEHFAVTTFDRWAFGFFKPGIVISDPSNSLPRERPDRPTALITPMVDAFVADPQRPPIMKILVYWCQMSRGQREACQIYALHHNSSIKCNCRWEALLTEADLEYHRMGYASD